MATVENVLEIMQQFTFRNFYNCLILKKKIKIKSCKNLLTYIKHALKTFWGNYLQISLLCFQINEIRALFLEFHLYFTQYTI